MPADKNVNTDNSSRDTEYLLLMRSLNASVSKHLVDDHFTVIWANERYYEMFGYTKEEYEARFHNHCDLFFQEDDPREWDKLVKFVSEAYSSGRHKYEYVCRMRHRNGKKLWVRLVGNMTDEMVNGFPVSYSVMMDITEQMQLRVEQSVTYNNFPGLVSKYKVTKDGFEFIEANGKYFEVFKKKSRYLFSEMAPESGLSAIAENYESFRKGDYVSFTIFQEDVSEKRVYMKVTAECVDWEDDDPIYLLLHVDVTQLTEQNELLEQKNAELEHIAYTDLVTGGMNRARFELDAGVAIRSKQKGSYALIWMNMQKFKLINDLAGNEQGDHTLRFVYDKICRHLHNGEIASRIAADDYTILLENGSDEEIVTRLYEIVEDINGFNKGKKYKYFLSFTAGIYRVKEPSLEITQIQDRAHVAMKEIRKSNSSGLCDCRFYSEQERAKLVEEKEIENRMRSALKEHQFEIYLQPKYSLKKRAVAGAEALVRWLDPQKGLVMPGRFIPIFEKNGFIVQLDLFVMEETCRLLRRWLDRGVEPLPISINVSRRHFTTPGFIESYAEICRKYNIPPKLIELEVTETIVFESPESFVKIVRLIHEAGFTCSMDDFGSGYSSLNLLKDIEVDTLKLDRAFFSTAQMESTRERDVVCSVIDMAKRLEMKTVAEGVETDQQQSFLEGTDCDLIQGFVFSKPLSIEAFERLVFHK